MIIPISHKSYPLPSPFSQNLATWAQSFQLDVLHVNPLNISAPTVSIIVVPSVDELLPAILTTNASNFIAPTISSMVIPKSSVPRPCLQPTTPSWTLPGTSLTMRSMREIGVLEMKLQDYKGNVTDVWDLLPFSSLSPPPLSHSLWDMITNNKGISSEIWDQFVGSDVSSIAS